MKRRRALVLADIPERNRLRELVEQVNARRDDIAELDVELELLRESLADFETRYHDRLRAEHEALRRIDSFVKHVERYSDALRDAIVAQARGRVVDVDAKARRIEQRRAREIEQRRAAKEEAAPASEKKAELASADLKTRIKTAYRALARKFHPDLARSEEERVKLGVHMGRINAFYRAGDIEKLERLVAQAEGGDAVPEEQTLEDQLTALSERLRWFETVHKNLIEERNALERSKTCELMRKVAQAEESGRDLMADLKGELTDRAARAELDVRAAIAALQEHVQAYNRKSAGGDEVKPAGEIVKRFDPYTDKALIRFGLEELAALRLGSEAEQCAEWIGSVAETHAPMLDAILLAYVSDLSPYPLPGLEHFEDIKLRFVVLEEERRALLDYPDEPWSFERTLVAADEVLEYGPRQMSEKVMRLGLRLRSNAMQQGMLLALREHKLRAAFKRVLSVIGERKHCETCAEDVFTVPLYRLRGLDALRALVCPHCGCTLHSYWMPKGDDVQAVLNGAFLDFDIVSEWSFALASSSIATQLARVELEETRVADLKRRLRADVFKRNGIDIPLAALSLEQHDKKVSERARVDELAERAFVVRFSADAGVNEADTLEVLKHRIRSRFTSA